jgi:hypothetical protein
MPSIGMLLIKYERCATEVSDGCDYVLSDCRFAASSIHGHASPSGPNRSNNQVHCDCPAATLQVRFLLHEETRHAFIFCHVAYTPGLVAS